MSQRIITIALILIIILGGGLYAYKQLVPPQTQETQGPVYATKEVIRGDISVGVNTTGMLNPTRGGGIRVPGERSYDGTPITFVLDKILVKDGDEVKNGQVIAMLKSYDLEVQLEEKRSKLEAKLKELSEMTGMQPEDINSINPSKGITIRSPADGRIINLEVKEGDELNLGQVITRVVDDSRYKVRAKLHPLEFKKVSLGQKILLKFPYFEGFIEGQITDINPNPIPDKDESGFASSYVYWITIEGENPGLVLPGMEVYAGLPSDESNTNAYLFINKAKVESYIQEKKIINKAEGIVTDVYVYDMQQVKEGDAILSLSGPDVQETLQSLIDEIRELQLEVRRLEAQFSQLEITASMDGVVASIHRQEGETVRPGEWIGDIFNTSEMMLWTQVDDIDIVHVKQDAPVKVTVDAVPGEIYEGKVTHVSPMGEKINGITRFSVNMQVKGGPQLRPGMQANAYIDAGSAKDVLLVPIEAIFEEDGKAMVEVLEPDGTVKLADIKLGLMNDRYAEVISGVKEGDLVITGSSADLLPSQHIKSNDNLLPDKEEDGNNDNGNPKPQSQN